MLTLTVWSGLGQTVAVFLATMGMSSLTSPQRTDNEINVIHRALDGTLWFETWSGVSRYDGEEFVNFTTEYGLANNKVIAIYAAANGVMWFGTLGGGVAAYDSKAWTSLDTRDGLANNVVQSIHPDVDGSLWFATQEGITRYRRSTTSPQVHIVSVTTDQTYRNLSALPEFTVGTRITIEYNSIDFLSIPEKRQYWTRITNQSEIETSTTYNPPTKETTFDWTPEKPGVYTFEVQAIDRDFNYSSRATLSLTVQLDPVLISMQTELNQLRHEVQRKYHFDNIVSRSDSMKYEYALLACNGNRTQAAKMLGIERKSLYEKMKRLEIDIPANISSPP